LFFSADLEDRTSGSVCLFQVLPIPILARVVYDSGTLACAGIFDFVQCVANVIRSRDPSFSDPRKLSTSGWRWFVGLRVLPLPMILARDFFCRDRSCAFALEYLTSRGVWGRLFSFSGSFLFRPFLSQIYTFDVRVALESSSVTRAWFFCRDFYFRVAPELEHLTYGRMGFRSPGSVCCTWYLRNLRFLILANF
jgi:hypothetical protein